MSSGFAVREKPRFILDVKGGLRECFFLFRQGEEDGPYSFEELEDLHASGKISPATPCRSRVAKEWHDLAYILRDSPGEQPPVPEVKTAAERPLAASPKVEPMNKLVMDLVELARRQNRLLVSIRWNLRGLAVILLAAGVVVARSIW